MKKLYLFMLTLFVAIAANATTLTADVYKWDYDTGSGVKADEQIQAEVTINNGVISFANFLGSDFSIDVTPSADGTATHNHENGTYTGTFSLGSFGTYDEILLYAGEWNYDDFDYSVSDSGVKTLHLGAYLGSGSDWFDIYFYLPDDFEPYNPYEGLEKKELPLYVYDYYGTTLVSTETVTAYIDGSTYHFINLFGMSDATYTIDKYANVKSNLNDWINAGYTYNGNSVTYTYYYGSQYAEYDTNESILKDYVYFWGSPNSIGAYYAIDLTGAEPFIYTTYDTNFKVTLYDAEGNEESTFTVPGTRDNENSVFLNGLFGATSVISYTVADDGTITSNLDGWKASDGYVYNETANSFIYGYGIKYLEYDTSVDVLTDYVFFYESNALRKYSIDICAHQKFETIVYKWDSAANSGVKAEKNIIVKADIDGGVITLPNFLGSDQTFVVSVYNDNTATHTFSAGKYSEGTYSFGEFGSYPTIQLYAGQWNYNDFSYYIEEDGTKELHFGAYAYASSNSRNGDWYDIYIVLPEDFTPIDPYAEYEKTNVIVNTYDANSEKVVLTETLPAYIKDNDIVIPGLYGMSVPTYTIADDGSISSSLSGWINSDSYVFDGVTNTYVYSYGKQYLSYDADSKVITDYIWFYQTNVGRYFTVALPSAGDATYAVYGDDGYGEATAIEGGVGYTISNGVVTLNNFLGSSYSPSFTILEGGKISNDGNGWTYDTFTVNGTTYNSIYVDNDYVTQSYAETDSTKTLKVAAYLDDTVIRFVITLPANFVPQELEKNVKIYAYDGEAETGDAIPYHLDYTIDGSTVTIANPFDIPGSFALPFTMQKDGTVVCSYNTGFYTKSCSFNGTSFVRFFDNKRVYDVDSKTLIWYVGFTADSSVKDYASLTDRYVVYLTLPDDFQPAAPQVSLTAKLYGATAKGREYVMSKSTAKAVVEDKENRNITLTSVLGSTVSVGISWDESGAITVDGSFPNSQYYSIGGDYFYNITIDTEKSKYVKNELDEYIELSLNTDEGYYGASAYANLPYRIFFEQNSTDVSGLTLYAYKYDAEAEDYEEDYESVTHAYSVDAKGTITIYNLLDSDQDVTFKLFEGYVDEDGDTVGDIETNLSAGTYAGTFSLGDVAYANLKYEGDSVGADWYKSGRSKYAELYATLDEQEVCLLFSIPSDAVYNKPYNATYQVDVYNGTTGAYGKSIYVKGYSEDGTATLPNFAGSGVELGFTVYEDNVVETTVDGESFAASRSGYYKVNGNNLLGNFNLDTYQISEFQVSSISYEFDNYESTWNIVMHGWGVPADGSDKFNLYLYIIVPEDFQPKEYEKNAEVHTVVDGVESEEGGKLHWDVTTSGSTVTIKNPFSPARTLTYTFTMQTDGTIDCSYPAEGYFTANQSYNGYSYGRIIHHKGEYLVDTNQFKWYIALCQVDASTKESYDLDEFVVYVQLPEDFKASNPKVDYATRVVSERNDREFVTVVANTVGDDAELENNIINVSSIMGKSASLQISWNEAGEVTLDNQSVKLSGYSYYVINDSYYQQLNFDAAASKYVKDDDDEYIELATTFTKGYNVDDLAAALRIYINKTSEDPAFSIIPVYVSEYDENENETYESLAHYYTVQDGKLIIKDFLDSSEDLEISYFDDETVVTNLQEGVSTASYYAFGTFAALTYGGDAENAGWGVDDGYKYTQIEVTIGEREYTITFYQPNNVSYTSGVNDLTVDDANGDVEYFNLQGIRVKNPANGIYIRRQGNRVSKVLVK